MCANFEPPPVEKLIAWGFAIAAGAHYKSEVYPGQVAPVITSADPNRIHLACFGLVPHWAEPKLARMTYKRAQRNRCKQTQFQNRLAQRAARRHPRSVLL